MDFQSDLSEYIAEIECKYRQAIDGLFESGDPAQFVADLDKYIHDDRVPYEAKLMAVCFVKMIIVLSEEG